MTFLTKRGRRTVGLVATTSAVLALVAGSPGGSDSGAGDGNAKDRKAKYKRVLRDPHPRPADVIWAAGAPRGVARADNGSLLLTYEVRNVEDDEGAAATAWRIVSRDGRTVAQYAEHTNMEASRVSFKGVPGGFVRVPDEGAKGTYVLGVRGKRHKFAIAEAPLGTRRGDILLAEQPSTLVYRPATRTAAPPAGVPEGAIGFAVDERGTTWSMVQPLAEEPHSVVWQRDGRTLGSKAVPKPYAGGDLAARGGTAALSLIQVVGEDEDGLEVERVRGLLVTTDSGKHWRTLLAGGIPWKDLDASSGSLVLQVLSDGRLLVGQTGGRYWLAADRTNSAFRKLKTPAPFKSLTVDGTTLYGITDATTPSYDLVKGEGLWISSDGGREWRRHK